MQDEFILQTPEQVQALAHPSRQQILRLLGDKPLTNKQIAEWLDEPPSRTHFHVRELLSAGLIELVSTQPKGGVLEKYYLATAKSYRLGVQVSAGATNELADTVLQSAQTELRAAVNHFKGKPPRMLNSQFHGSLSEESFQRVKNHLQAIQTEFEHSQQNEKHQPYVLTFLMHPTCK